ncbi:MAG: peptidyl-prolyl cis-trans isomerase [Lachnospiraceae bacterium]|nr:peptidyl-prolyl cis-trans isomerase [Lachnospiraceae bacterium]
MKKKMKHSQFMQGKKKRLRVSLVGLLIVTMLFGCVGCSNASKGKVSVEEAKSTIIMSLGDDYDVTLSEFYLYLIQYLYMQQMDPDSMLDSDDSSAIDTVLKQMRLELVEYLVALNTEDVKVKQENLDAVETDTANYMELFGKDFLAEYGIDEACVKQLFTEQAYIIALTDKAVEDMKKDYYEQYSKEYADNTFCSLSYALFPSIRYDEEGNAQTDDDGEYISLSEDEMKEQYAKAEELHRRALEGESLEDLIEEYGISASSGEEHNYKGAYSAKLNQAIENMNTGDISDIIETEAGYMIARMDNPDDTDYKEYVIQYAASDTANNMLTQMQQNWLSASGYSEAEADKEQLSKIDIKNLCQRMKDNGIY